MLCRLVICVLSKMVHLGVESSSVAEAVIVVLMQSLTEHLADCPTG